MALGGFLPGRHLIRPIRLPSCHSWCLFDLESGRARSTGLETPWRWFLSGLFERRPRSAAAARSHGYAIVETATSRREIRMNRCLFACAALALAAGSANAAFFSFASDTTDHAWVFTGSAGNVSS